MPTAAGLEACQFGAAQFGGALFGGALTLGHEASDPANFTAGRGLPKVIEFGGGNAVPVDKFEAVAAPLPYGTAELMRLCVRGVSMAALVSLGRVIPCNTSAAIAGDRVFRALQAPRPDAWL
ncbi:MAG: hypothetical protein LH471_00115 [Salinibacterium sp.]|nr:hypothetical protein [Salinibacterium sp.]